MRLLITVLRIVTLVMLMQGIDDNASQEVRNLIEQYYCNPYFLYEDYVESQT